MRKKWPGQAGVRNSARRTAPKKAMAMQNAAEKVEREVR